MHEEWAALVMGDLGAVTGAILDFGDGNTLRAKLDVLHAVVDAWKQWAETKDVDGRLAIEQESEDSGCGFIRSASVEFSS